jgi:hypothetical protein
MEGCLKSDESTAVFDLSLGESESDSSQEERVYKDPISTGRKRAAVMYPLSPGQVCDWAWKKNAGGGIEPITGCTGRPATHIHHGPDKSTFNNDRSNISLLCNFCHNRWHVANDKYYIEPRPADNSEWLPIKYPELDIQGLDTIQTATKMEILTAEMLIPEGGKDGR